VKTGSHKQKLDSGLQLAGMTTGKHTMTNKRLSFPSALIGNPGVLKSADSGLNLAGMTNKKVVIPSGTRDLGC
jgi:hypothetical protein